ncbi:MAG: RNA 2',3'-cyclic phosphodiesterase [Ignavibacteriaceae bacterium]|nr:RNA 2',3'-cyclic phosphodiesterase [Ignavibacteriaceae bacterium]
MIRLFIALKIPLYIRKEIVNLTSGFLPGYDNYKWEQIDKVHLTLKFIGDVKEELVNEVKEKISFINGYKKFECGLDKYDFFYRYRKPSIFFMKLQMEQRINELVIRLNNELEKIGIPREKKEFHAHLTLLRIKGNEDIAPLTKMTETGIELKDKFIADEITLYQSRLLSHGSLYKELLNFKLN